MAWNKKTNLKLKEKNKMKISECHYAVEVPSVISQVGEYPKVFVPV